MPELRRETLNEPAPEEKALYIIVGGFLGAGKTTAILQLARLLRERGQRVGLITNDQSFGLVDTAMLGASGFPVEEITGGCFCCKFDSLVDAARNLSLDHRPDAFIAEPVGSCTDLKATVDYPLRRIYGDRYTIAPLSVLVDPVRAERILGLREGSSFSDKVIYIYRKQLEEADLIIVNKADLLTDERIAGLMQTLQLQFPRSRVLQMSARRNHGVEQWLAAIESEVPHTSDSLSIDYDTYADGEALLGWMNATVGVRGAVPVDGNRLVLDIAARLCQALQRESVQIAHLKLTLTPDTGVDLAIANIVRNEAAAELSHTLQDPLQAGQLIINLRAECDPQLLQVTLERELRTLEEAADVTLAVHHLQAFRPGRPTPTHRLAGTAAGKIA